MVQGEEGRNRQLCFIDQLVALRDTVHLLPASEPRGRIEFRGYQVICDRYDTVS